MTSADLARLVEEVTREVLGRLDGAVPFGGPAHPPDIARLPPRFLVAGNWKMNPCTPDVATYLAALAGVPTREVDVLLLPPAVFLSGLRAACDAAGLRHVELGAQDVHPAPKGAHTGEHSGALLWDAGARHTLVGHSERRQAGETDALVAQKIRAGWDAGLSVMLCVGESLADRRSGATFRVLRQQMRLALGTQAQALPAPHRLAVAYEPVWAIGTGERASPGQIQEACAFLRRVLAETYDFHRARAIRILYGGSVTGENAPEVMSLGDVDGALVGGASLDGRSFGAIVAAAARAADRRAAGNRAAVHRRSSP